MKNRGLANEGRHDSRKASSFCPTSKMSHGHSGHDSCLIRKLSLLLQFEREYNSTRHDRCGRWLWRLVELFRLSSVENHVPHSAAGHHVTNCQYSRFLAQCDV